jgi:hypothetical protein
MAIIRKSVKVELEIVVDFEVDDNEDVQISDEEVHEAARGVLADITYGNDDNMNDFVDAISDHTGWLISDLRVYVIKQ